ncbi:MAG: archease [candidate division Zixibacteria bacterium]|nr:archease [candidate division Zixibacteria bacterium]
MKSKKYGYNYLDDIATADAAFEVSAADLKQLFELSAEAMFNIIMDIDKVPPTAGSRVNLKSDSLEELLYLFLSELLYLKDINQMIYSNFCVNINGCYDLNAVVSGEKFEKIGISPKIDIKAVTYYNFKVERRGDDYYAVVVVDL